MLKTIIIGAVLLFIAILLMGINVFFTKKRKFPNTHIGASKAMHTRGISCATSQDTSMRSKISPVELALKSENNK
ncbi:MAG: hypothetical protein PHO94_00090 [Petrimonas sp.]|nr:hypothetical protein [Petrimonas sp.]